MKLVKFSAEPCLVKVSVASPHGNIHSKKFCSPTVLFPVLLPTVAAPQETFYVH